MRVRLGAVFALAASSLALAATGTAAVPQVAEFQGYSASLRLEGSNGYAIAVSAFSERADGKGDVSISAFKKGESATYTAPAVVTETTLHADLGAFGRIDAVRRASGREKSVRTPCGGRRVTYEPAVYEGVFELRGEGGYTRVDQSSAPTTPLPFFFGSLCGSGRGEALNDDRLPGARLKGTSYAQGRVLKFQVNKNRRKAPTVFTASVRERQGRFQTYRTLAGKLPARAFRFPHSLRTAAMSPPAPFAGRASLTRSRSSVLPAWRGDLTLDFPGAPRVPLAGPDVYVSLVHARFDRGGDGTVGIVFRHR
jgi:hypothetical protein